MSSSPRTLLACALIAAGCQCADHPLTPIDVNPEQRPDAGHPAAGDGGTSCANALDLHGCACGDGTATRSCYPGPSQQAGVGACVLGQQTCTASGELAAGTWGPCVGSGQPTTCAAAGAECGTLADDCGGVLQCGSCPSMQTCGGGSANHCGTGPCNPNTCANLGVSCGPASDGCGGTLDCGSCSAPATCGGGGAPGVCACTAKTCASLGVGCGMVSDGCGGTVDCGSCTSPETCGGGGVPGACGCAAKTCEGLGFDCGVVSNGCGGALSCGSCTSPATCGGAGVPNVCGCVAKTCAGLGFSCGSPSDGCGGTLNCGSCTAPETCGGGGTTGVCGSSYTGPGCGPLQHCSFGVTADELMGGAHPFQMTATAADCQAYCNSFPDTVCCTWSENLGYGTPCAAITNPACAAAPTPGGEGWTYDPSCHLAGGTYFWGSVCNH